MEVKVQRTTILSHADIPNAMEREIPLTIFDRFASNLHIAVLFAFTPPTPSNAALLDGLSKAITLFPTLTARLGYIHTHRRPCVILGGGGGGALVVEATVSSELSTHLPLEPSPELQLLHPSPYDADHLLQIQLNRFNCGGVVIGATAHHRVADGQSMSTFFVSWSQIVRGVTVDRLPVYDQSWLRPRRPPRCEFEHWGLDFIPTPISHQYTKIDPTKITNILLRYSSDYIRKLKAEVNNKYTTFETLLAHLWRKITIARGLQDSENTMVRVTVNGRTRLKPPVSNEFFGNLVLNAYPKANVKKLIAGGLAAAARVVHEKVAETDEGYFQSFMDFGELHGEEELVPAYDVDGNVISPELEVDSWVRLRFKEMDFGGGGGELRGFLPTWVPYEGLVIFLPGLGEEGGGVDAFVTLIEDHGKILREIFYSFD